MTNPKILVALDRSSQASLVFAQALEFAQKPHSSLMIFQVVDWEGENTTNDTLALGTLGSVDLMDRSLGIRQTLLQRRITESKDWLKPYYQQAIEKGIFTEFASKSGDPGEKICQFARDWQANLIIMGRRGHQGLSEVLLGSVSNYVLHYAPCSVLLVH